jgi:ABC-2 type transport system permease protein
MSTIAATPPSIQFDDSRTNTSLAHVLRSEWTKIWSVRSTLWTMVTALIVTVGFSTLFAWGASSNLATMPPEQRATLDPTNIALAGLAFGQLAIAVLGVLVVTSEYSTGGIKTTLIAVPNRLRVLTAKALVFAVIAWVVGTIASFGAFWVSMLFWSRHNLEAHLGDPGVLRAVLGGGLLALASGLFGFALGVLIRHTAGAITAMVALLFVVPPLTGLLPGTWGKDISKYFTTNASQRITEVVHTPGQLSPWVGYFAMTIEWLVPLLVGAYLMQRRDA